MDVITHKHDEFVFCFGSNLSGVHGKGAALTAKRYFGAAEGIGEGFAGCSYAIPTKDEKIRTLPLPEIETHISRFLVFAAHSPDKKFMVTRIGCGLAGYQDKDIAELFYRNNIPGNVFLPGIWQQASRNNLPARVIIAGGRDFNDYPRLREKCQKILSRQSDIEIISGCAKGADALGERFCAEMAELGHNYTLVRFPAAWDRFGKVAGMLRNAAMAQYGEYLIAAWNGSSSGTRNMINLATKERLAVRTIKY